MILLDTSVLIDFADLELPREPVALSAITYAELSFGIEQAQDAETRRSRVLRRSWLGRVLGSEWLPFDTAAAQRYAHLAATVAKTRPAHARTKDIMLAGQALALGARLATLNPKDFELIADEVEIVVPRWRHAS